MKTPFSARCSALIVFVPALAWAQQAPSPSSQLAANGPTLDVTLKFIADKVNAEGKFSYSATITDSATQGPEWTNRFEALLSNLAGAPLACRITFHWRTLVNGTVADDSDYGINLQKLTKVVVLSQVEYQHQIDSRSGHDSYQSRIMPPQFVLVMKPGNDLESIFLFHDEDMANRVARAVSHAVELCAATEKL